MTNEERAQALVDKCLEEMLNPDPAWYWLSFIDPDRPQGRRFLGVAVVRAEGPLSATNKAHDLGINPGGEVAIIRLPDDYKVIPEYVHRLLRVEEATQMREANERRH